MSGKKKRNGEEQSGKACWKKREEAKETISPQVTFFLSLLPPSAHKEKTSQLYLFNLQLLYCSESLQQQLPGTAHS